MEFPTVRPLQLVTLTLALSATAAAAQDRPDSTRADTTVYRLDELRVVATRPVTTVGGASAYEIHMDSMSLAVSPTVEDVLRELPSVHVRTNSRGEAEISVRGSESRQVAVLLDGVPLTLGWDARTDVSVLPAGATTEISLVRGLSSMLHGPNVLGGVVQMSVGHGTSFPEHASLQVSGGIDEVGGYGTSVTGARPFESTSGRWLLRGGFGLRDSPGATLPQGVREPVPTEESLRLNTDFSEFNGFGALRFQGDGGRWFSLSGSGFKAERGIAGELDVEEPRLWRYPDITRAIVAASGGTGDRATPWGRGDLEVSLGLDLGRTEIESFATRAYDEVIGTEEGDARTLTVRMLGDHTLGRFGDLRAAFTYADINHDATTDGELREYRQQLTSLGVETIWKLVDASDGAIEALRFSVGGAFDQGKTPETGGLPSLGTLDDWGARAGLSAVVNDGRTLLHMGASRRGRFPALRETYSEALNRFEPNPDLQPEHLVAFEGGVTTRLGGGDLQVVGFHHRLSDAIRRITLPSRLRKRVNSDRLESTGAELLLTQSFGGLTLSGDLTLQSVQLFDTVDVSSQPENLPEVSGSVQARFPLFSGVSATTALRYTGTQFCQHPDTGADVELAGGAWWNVDVGRSWALPSSTGSRLMSRVEARVGVDNLTDTALYDQCGLPRPGRLLRVQFRLF
ncbi:MAG: TonB-dependent receptor [Gemmatimonadota bacterium]